MASPTISLTVTKIDSTTFSTAKTRAINPENIITMITQADNKVVISYYDSLRAKLTLIETTTNVNTIFAAMQSPLLVGVYSIGTSTINRPMVLNRTAMTMTAGSANPYTISYNMGERVTVDKKQISAFITPSAISETITSASQSAKTFRVATDLTTTFVAGLAFRVSGSTGGSATGNDKLYTVVSSAYTTYTTITVRETIPSAATDGTIIGA